MNQRQGDVRYRELLLLSYFKSNYKSYEYAEVVELLGITFDELKNILSNLIDRGLLVQYENFLVVSKLGEQLLCKERMDAFFDEKRNVKQIEKWDVEKPYIPINFHL